MKKILLLGLLLLDLVYANAQTKSNDMERITIHAILPDNIKIPPESLDLLETKLTQIITENGVEDNEYGVRFVLTAKVNVITKDILAGPPQRISQKLDLTLILGDIVEDKVFSRKTISVIGVGTSEEKSFISAFKNIKPNNKDIALFMQDGKQKILDFYQTHCQDIIVEARDFANRELFEQSILMLSAIPNVSSECFSECVKITEIVYQQMITVRGEELLHKAQNTWSKNPTRQGALEATRYLQQINHAAPCQTEVTKLLNQISEKMNEIDRREWEHEMQVYKDGVERERREWEHKMQVYNDDRERENRQWEQHVREHNDNVETQRMFIKAARDVAIEQARNQPKEVNLYHVNYTKIYSW